MSDLPPLRVPGVALLAASLTLGCSARVDEQEPLPSASIIRTKNTAHAPHAAASAHPVAIPSASSPAPSPSASALASVPWDGLDAYTLGAQTVKGEVTVSYLPPLVMGGAYAAADVAAAVEAFSLNYKTCFAEAKGDPEDAKVNVHFAVSPKGKATEIELTSTLKGEEKAPLLACIKPWVERIELAPPTGGAPTVAVQMTLSRAPATIAGVLPEKLTLGLLKAALKTLGCTRVVDNEGRSPTTLKAECVVEEAKEPEHLTIVFVPKLEAESSKLPSEETRKTYLTEGVVLESGGTFIGIRAKNEPKRAAAFLERMAALPKAAPPAP